jgi:hypothetical protein
MIIDNLGIKSDKIKVWWKILADSARIHGDKYDYSLFEYINSNDKVKIICREHGVFEQEWETIHMVKDVVNVIKKD